MNLPFPDGHDKSLDKPKRFKCKGIMDKSLKNKEVILNPITEMDIINIKNILVEEIKRQIKEEENETTIKS